MDIASYIGMIGVLIVVLIGAFLGGSLNGLLDAGSVFITIGGSFLSMFLNYPLSVILGVFKIMGKAFKIPDFGEKTLIQKLVSFSERSRREGLLALEEELEDLDDEFMKKGLRLVVDGTDAEVIRNIMETELSQMETRHGTWISVLNVWAGLGPAYGMIGTVIGLIGMLSNLEDKSSLGGNMAVALVTTLYGSLLANWILSPIAGKLAYQNGREVTSKEMIIEGILSIQNGDNPRILGMKLLGYLDPSDRKAVESEVLKD